MPTRPGARLALPKSRPIGEKVRDECSARVGLNAMSGDGLARATSRASVAKDALAAVLALYSVISVLALAYYSTSTSVSPGLWAAVVAMAVVLMFSATGLWWGWKSGWWSTLVVLVVMSTLWGMGLYRNYLESGDNTLLVEVLLGLVAAPGGLFYLLSRPSTVMACFKGTGPFSGRLGTARLVVSLFAFVLWISAALVML